MPAADLQPAYILFGAIVDYKIYTEKMIYNSFLLSISGLEAYVRAVSLDIRPER